MSLFKHAIFCLFGFASITAILYSCLLPIWGGFDEPFHYAYVESISQEGTVPVLGRSYISMEIEQSLKLLAFSSTLPPALRPEFLAQGWTNLNSDEQRLRVVPSAGGVLNYEAQQAPLAYLLLAPENKLLSGCTLRTRVFLLRLVLSLTSVALSLLAANFLFRELQLQREFRLIALFCFATSQMLFATVAHICNDWLAVPLMIGFIAYLARFSKRPGQEKRPLWLLATTLAAGLLTKAYFLAYVPIFCFATIFSYWRHKLPYLRIVLALAIPAVTAGPWYLRNKLLVGTFSGLQDSGIAPGGIVTALWNINWFESLPSLARWSLWTGNWSFVSFSKSTLDFDLFLIAMGFILYVARRKQITSAETWMLAATLSFVLALLYDGAMYSAFTHGAAKHAEPYYTQGILPCIWGTALLGAQRSGVIGRAVATILLLTNAWIALNTYVAKLIPFYGGMTGKSTVGSVLGWWLHGSKLILGSAAMAPLSVLYAITFLQTVSLLLCLAFVLRSTIVKG